MATISATLTLTSSNWHSDPLNIAPSASLTVEGNEQAIGRYTTAAVAAKLPVGIFDSADRKVWIYLKNLSADSLEKIQLLEDNGGAAGNLFSILGSGEWAFFPYAENDYLWISSASGTPVLEYGVFEV
jgi:hypothetical protein